MSPQGAKQPEKAASTSVDEVACKGALLPLRLVRVAAADLLLVHGTSGTPARTPSRENTGESVRHMKDPIEIEQVVHGQRWGSFHNGYFSDPAIASPLVNAALNVLAKAPADVVVDLGGGTGFLLSQLAAQGAGATAALVNVDCSEAQLAMAGKAGISAVHASIGEFRRRDVAAENQRLFLLMRSVLHYLGEEGLRPLLRHLRDQAKDGEFFVHQNAAFANPVEATCLNALYQQMRTPKWYTTVDDLKGRLAEAGWRVLDTITAPTLVLTSDDLGLRYALDAADLARIRDRMTNEFGEQNNVFHLTPGGFHADLHYRIFTCVAVPR